MKNGVKKALLALLIVTMSLALLTACGSKQKISGTFYFVSMEQDGNTITAQDLERVGYSADDIIIELNADGTCSMTLLNDTGNGTYKLDGDKLEITIDGETVSATVDGDRIILQQDDGESTIEIIFEKK